MSTTQQFKVYHAINPTFSGILGNRITFNTNNFEHVATVECEDLEQVFALTNHIEQNWTTNKEVIWFKSKRVRSTSVGDVVIDSTGKKFSVGMTGYTTALE